MMWLLSHLFKLDKPECRNEDNSQWHWVPRSIESKERIKRIERTERRRGSPVDVRTPETLKEFPPLRIGAILRACLQDAGQICNMPTATYIQWAVVGTQRTALPEVSRILQYKYQKSKGLQQKYHTRENPFFAALQQLQYFTFSASKFVSNKQMAKCFANVYFADGTIDVLPQGTPFKFYFSSPVGQNRFLKAAMSERLTSRSPSNFSSRGMPLAELINEYRRCREGRFGMIVTGNFMIE